MPLLVVCWCHSQLTRHCFWGWWTCPQVLKDLTFNVEISLLWLRHMYYVLSALTRKPILPTACLGGWICLKLYVIGVVRAHNSLCGVSSASFLCQLLAVFFHLIYRRSKHVVWANNKCIGLMYLFAPHVLQCSSSLCLHPVSILLLSCFYIASL